MRFGLALPHYDFSAPGLREPSWELVRDTARRAEELGFDSVWMSDHLFFGLSKYGGGDEPRGTLECFTSMAALLASTERVTVGSLVACNDLRHPALLAKTASSLSALAPGRVSIGMGAGWFEPEYEAAGVSFDPPGVRVSRLAEAVQVVKGLTSSSPFEFEGEHYKVEGAWNVPNQDAPTVFVGGKGPRVVSIAGRYSDGYNAVWSWTVDDYARQLDMLKEACARGDGAYEDLWKSVGLYTLVVDDAGQLEERFGQYVSATPGASGTQLSDWVSGKLAGTPDEIYAQIKRFEEIGVQEVILGFGMIPFQLCDPAGVEIFGEQIIPRFRDQP